MTAPAKSDTPLRQAAQWSVRLNEAPGDEDLRRAFERWLDQSPAHAIAWEDLGQVTSLMRKIPTSRASSRRPRARIVVACGIAAALIAAVLAPSTALRWTADYVADIGHERTIALADGSTVRLAPGSAISIDRQGDRRDVRLVTGEAYFEVAHDPTRPFHVEAKDARVTVLGTGFNVRMGAAGTDVAVRHGRVRVERNDAGVTVLNGGDWTRAVPGGVRIGRSAPEIVGAWRQDRLIALDQTVTEMLSDARRRHRGVIILTDGGLGRRTVTGSYDMTDPASGLAVMVEPLGGKVRRITPWVIIVST